MQIFLEINININNIIFFLKNNFIKNFEIIIYFIKITLIFLNSIFMKNQLLNSQKISLFLFIFWLGHLPATKFLTRVRWWIR